MTLDPFAFSLVMLSALLHAGWNTIAKRAHDGLVAMALIKAPNLVISLVVIAVVGLPNAPAWPYILGSTVVNILYFYFLINAYRLGDLSVAYPVARGVAPLLVLLFSFVLLREVPTVGAVLGVLVICFGIFLIGSQRRATRQHYHAMLWALGVGFCIATYTIIDGAGARAGGNPIGYVAMLNIFTGIAVCGTALVRRKSALAAALRTDWLNGVIGGAMMLASYTLVVYALTIAPMGPVAALRETSVVFAAAIGAVMLKEPFGRRRVVAAVAVAAGIGILVALG
jgi:drug/metabolite transporter (DMT)-like permease